MHQTPPFDAAAARRLRVALGMAPGHVAYGLRAQYGLNVSADTVAAWERGTEAPGSQELSALAGVLWCSPGELLAEPTSLRDHRIARGLSAEELARRVGLDTGAYLAMEDASRWRGNPRQSEALAEALGLDLRAFVVVAGREDELAGLLRDAATTRWQAYVRPVSKLVPLPRQRLEEVLRDLHEEYQSRMVATLSWGANTAPTDTSSGAAGRDLLDGITDHFWSRLHAGE